MVPDLDSIDIPPQYSIMPDAGVVPEGDVTDHHPGRGDVDPFAQNRLLSKELIQLSAQSTHLDVGKRRAFLGWAHGGNNTQNP